MKSKIPVILIARLLVALLVGVVVFFVSKKIYFYDNPLLQIQNLGEVLVFLPVFVLLFLFSPVIGKNISIWFENLVAKAVRKVVSDFMKMRSERLAVSKTAKEKSEEKKGEEELKKLSKTSPVVIDTSSIIDGRVSEVIKLGFLDAHIVVPQFIIDELQHIADSKDDIRRQRGRRGLDILNNIKKLKKNSFKVVDVKISEPVDKELVRLTKKVNGRLVTADFNLNKAAKISGVRVLNVNDLVNSLKTVVLPGENIFVKVLHPGKEDGQGVGYLDDGTMVVVENGHSLIGKGDSKAYVSRVIQTAAGRMVFCLPRS